MLRSRRKPASRSSSENRSETRSNRSRVHYSVNPRSLIEASFRKRAIPVFILRKLNFS